MLSSIQGMTKFDNYDPLGMIPQEDTLDWSTPDCSIDCELDLYPIRIKFFVIKTHNWLKFFERVYFL